MISPELARTGAAIEHARASTPQVVRVLQVALDGRANGSQGTTVAGRMWRARRTRGLRAGTRAVLAGAGLGDAWTRWGWLGAVVQITRVAPRRLDGDNATAAAKPVRDGVADALGIHDRDPRVEWLVDQELGAPSVRVELYRWDAMQGLQTARRRTNRVEALPRDGSAQNVELTPGQGPSRPMTKMSRYQPRESHE